jgi:hypothetical protein
MRALLTASLHVVALALLLAAPSCNSTSKDEAVLTSNGERVVLSKRPPGTYEVRALLVRQIETRLDRPWRVSTEPAALAALREAFADAVRADLVPAYALADAPGPGVYEVQTIVTDRIRDEALRERLPESARGTATRPFLELWLVDCSSGETVVSAIWAPQQVAWERVLDPHVSQQARVGALRTFTGALREGLDRNKAAYVR